MVEYIVEELQKKYKAVEKDVKNFKEIKAKGMCFKIKQFEIEKVGNLSVLKGEGMAGLMKMDTVIVNPFYVDAPLFSYDRIFALGNDTMILELYDTRLQKVLLNEFKKVKEEAAKFNLHPLGEHWYDGIKLDESISVKGKKKTTTQFDEVAKGFVSAYLNTLEKAGICNADEKRKKAREYTEGLLENGGPSTDAFKKILGKEKTEELFRSIVFGTGK